MDDGLLRYSMLTGNVLSKLSPMMRQYLDIKHKHDDCIIMFRLGDFYEMFFDDAILVSSELGLTLTGRDCGLSERAPMCGVPYHAVQKYTKQLVERGFRLAICEQVTDPSLTKGLVDRQVVKVVTPGTVTDEDALDEKNHNYIMSVFIERNGIGYAYADVSTGRFCVGNFSDSNFASAFYNELRIISPTEIILPRTAQSGTGEQYEALRRDFYTQAYSDRGFDFKRAANLLMNHFRAASLVSLGVAEWERSVCAAGALLAYLGDTQLNTLRHISKLETAKSESYMHMDDFTRVNLELVAPLRRDGTKSSTLLGVLDHTVTAMGARLIKEYILRPLQNKAEIERRLNSVQELTESVISLDALREALKGMCDIERICAKISGNALNPKNCVSLKYALKKIWQIKQLMPGFHSEDLCRICTDLDTLDDLRDLIDAALIDDPPINIRDGGAIRAGFDKSVDAYNELSGNGQKWLSELEARERDETGIKTLKVGYNRVFGYYIEVSKSFMNQVPDRFIRKQTLANSERYFTAELKELEERALSAEEKCIEREVQIFSDIQSAVAGSLTKLQKNAAVISQLDVYLSFAKAAVSNHYVKPQINTDGIIDIKQGRHPMVEANMKDSFRPNDAFLTDNKDRVLIITGPNMAGKSTYMRQTALLVLMAHIGSFIPAQYADICMVDRIFTRVGASDNLSSGQSTFMVEMSEMACILNSATENSLIILDEIGRGTATYDGLSIAWAVLEHIVNVTRAKCLFATHYHELTSLENEYDCIKNYSVSVKEVGDSIVFLHEIVPYGADRSFGIQVAALAGLPDEVIARAKLILKEHEGLLSSARDNAPSESAEDKKRKLIAETVYDEIAAIDPNMLSPRDALSIVFRLRDLID